MSEALRTPRALGALRREVLLNEPWGAAGPAEEDQLDFTSTSFIGAIGEHFDVVARIAGTTPPRDGDSPTTRRHCYRTVDAGQALCCPRPLKEPVRLGALVRVSGTITGHRMQAGNYVTEVQAESLDFQA